MGKIVGRTYFKDIHQNDARRQAGAISVVIFLLLDIQSTYLAVL